MSTTTITRTFTIGGVLTDMTSVIFNDPTGTFGVKRLDTGATIVAAGVALTHISTGVYSYTFTDPAYNLTYDFWVEFVYLGNTYRVERTIAGTLSSPPPTSAQVISQVAPLMSLEEFRLQLHYNPWHFWGWMNETVPVESACNTIVKEYAYQTQNAVGRNEIRQALIESESRLRDYLGYSIAPRFIVDEIQDYPRFYDKNLWATFPVDGSGHWKSVTLKEGYVKAVGIEKLTLLATPMVAYTDADGDGLNETFTLTLATTITDPSQIAVYFAVGDRLNNEAAGDRWHVQPVTVTIASGTCTIRGKAWMLAKPILYEPYNFTSLDPSNASNFVATLEVYQRVCDPTGTTVDTAQGKFIWQTLPYVSWWGLMSVQSLTNGSTDPAAQAYSVARVGINGNGKLGIVIPGEAIYDATTGFWNTTVPPWSNGLLRPPDKVMIRYEAGYPLNGQGQIDSKFQTADFRLACAQLDNRISACDESMRELFRWQREMSQVADKTEMYRVANQDLTCPFGTRRGAIDAWNQVKHLRLIRGVTNN